MSQVFTGVAIVVDGFNDAKVFAEMVSSLDFDMLKELNQGRPLSIDREQFDSFVGKYSHGLIQAGILNEELEPTGKVSLSIN